jgi:hypothetical protein
MPAIASLPATANENPSTSAYRYVQRVATTSRLLCADRLLVLPLAVDALS